MSKQRQTHKHERTRNGMARRSKRAPSPAAVARFEKRKSVVAAVQRGEVVRVVARVFDVPMRTIFCWLAWYRQGGWDALRDGVRQGRPPKVNAEVMTWLYDVICGGDPRQLQFEFCLWTLNIVRAALKRYHDIELSKSSASRLLAQLGLTPQVPVYRSYKRSPAKIRYYLKKRFPRAVALAKSLGAEIYFADESRVRADGHRGTTWAPIGKTPEVEDSGERFGINLISAVSARGSMHFQTFEGRMNSERFINFLCDLRHDAGRPVLVIVDGGSYHVSKEVKRFLKDPQRAEGIHLFRLPAYSPELNPDEQVWNHAKARLGKLFIESRQKLRDSVAAIMSTIQKSQNLIKSFFQMETTAYANIIL